MPLTFPPAPFLSQTVEAEGGISGAGAISRPSSPLSRSAGEGPGVRAALTSPLPLPLPRCGRGGGDERSRGVPAAVNDTVSSALPSPAARERGRG